MFQLRVEKGFFVPFFLKLLSEKNIVFDGVVNDPRTLADVCDGAVNKHL